MSFLFNNYSPGWDWWVHPNTVWSEKCNWWPLWRSSKYAMCNHSAHGRFGFSFHWSRLKKKKKRTFIQRYTRSTIILCNEYLLKIWGKRFFFFLNKNTVLLRLIRFLTWQDSSNFARDITLPPPISFRAWIWKMLAAGKYFF